MYYIGEFCSFWSLCCFIFWVIHSGETIYSSIWSTAKAPYVRELEYAEEMCSEHRKYVYVRIDGVRRKDVGQFHTREIFRWRCIRGVSQVDVMENEIVLRTASNIWCNANNSVSGSCCERDLLQKTILGIYLLLLIVHAQRICVQIDMKNSILYILNKK